MGNFYKHNNSIQAMTNEELEKAMLAAEAKCMTDQFKHAGLEATTTHMAEVKKDWPDDAKEWLRQRVKDSSAGKTITGGMIAVAMRAAAVQFVAPKRANGKPAFLAMESRIAAAEMSLAMALGRAPDAKPVYAPRKYRDITNGESVVEGPTMCVKCSTRDARLVIETEEIDRAEVYVFGIYNEHLQRAWLAGWMSREDLKKCKRGNRFTDPENCRWGRMAHYLNFSEMKPMHELLKNLGVAEIPGGLLFEKVPDASILPIPVQYDLPKPSVTDFDWFDAALAK